jgi:hypothetical protein
VCLPGNRYPYFFSYLQYIAIGSNGWRKYKCKKYDRLKSTLPVPDIIRSGIKRWWVRSRYRWSGKNKLKNLSDGTGTYHYIVLTSMD